MLSDKAAMAMSDRRMYPATAEEIIQPETIDLAGVKEILGLTIGELGQVAGKSQRSAARWLAAEDAVPLTGDSARAIRRMAYLGRLLDDVVGSAAGSEWVRLPNPGLRGEAPIDLMTSGRIEDVIGVLELLADGAPA